MEMLFTVTACGDVIEECRDYRDANKVAIDLVAEGFDLNEIKINEQELIFDQELGGFRPPELLDLQEVGTFGEEAIGHLPGDEAQEAQDAYWASISAIKACT